MGREPPGRENLAVRHLADHHLAVNHRATTAAAAKRNFVKKARHWLRPILRATIPHAKMLNSSGRIFELCRNRGSSERSGIERDLRDAMPIPDDRH